MDGMWFAMFIWSLPDLHLHPRLWLLETRFFCTLLPAASSIPVGGEHHDVVGVLPLLHRLHLPSCLGCPLLPGKRHCPANVFHLNIILERPFVSEPFQLVKKKSSMWGTLLLRKWVLEKGLQASRLLVATSNTSSTTSSNTTTSSRHCSGTWDYQ